MARAKTQKIHVVISTEGINLSQTPRIGAG